MVGDCVSLSMPCHHLVIPSLYVPQCMHTVANSDVYHLV